jgi:tetratricopeptide (TPR) repeat protein
MTVPARVLAAVVLPLFVPLALAPASPADARQSAPELPAVFKELMPLFETGLGPFTRPMSSTSPEAQAYFDQGFQMMYAFAKQDATRSFREAWARDPTCAICYWAEAWSWGSYLNGQMTRREAPFAYAAIQKAMALREDHATAKERAFIEAMAVRYVEDFDPARREVQDRAYADAMRRVWEAYPDDLDAGTLYGEALFLLEPRRGTRDVGSPSVQRLHQVLEAVLAADIRHPGACHLYVHATESTVVPEKAEPCAEYLADAIPGASHINHMPSHTWSQTGRWGDAVRVNIQAWHSDLKAGIGEGFAIYPSHNLHMLAFAASMDGQGAVATQAGKDYAKLTGDTMYQVLTLVRFGRFDEIPGVEARPSSPISGGMWDFAQGYAKLRAGESDFARVYLARVREGAGSDAVFRGHSAAHLLGTVAGILEGEILRADDRLADAITAFEAAVALEDELVYDEPEPLPFAPRHWLGAALLEVGRFADAERAYRDELADHPRNGWSLVGLQQALEAQGRPSADVEAERVASWARADTWLRGSRF